MAKTIYCGTYTSHGSQGIYAFDDDKGQLSNVRLFSTMKNPKYITLADDHIASLGDFPGGSGVALLRKDGTFIDAIAYEDRTSCFVAYHEGKLYTANYHLGTLSVLEVNESHMRLLETVVIQDGAGAHQVLFHEDKVLVPCLFLDRVLIFDANLRKIDSIRFNQGTGPRHGVFTKDGSYLYLTSELSNELFVINTENWQIEHQIPILENGETHVRDTAAIRLSNDEKHLYISTRTKDVISVITLDNHVPTLKQVVSCGGKHPRDFIICDDHLLIANRNSDNVVSMKIREDGTLGEIISEINVPEVVSLVEE